ncbi:MAG: AAA-like domain-containing protein [Gammaproteobacteria bacterium]|nr:AAA-like domain-containing protein [Gammaproteobacteria bacterium]MDE0269677.1 AAA-like domain-containing protein [Gammaproteobacteria bacterium]
MKFFNTAGPMVAERHYQVPPLSRLDLEELDRLIDDWRYFVLHAPRQTGKTTALFTLRDRLNATGRYRCVYVNVEPAQMAREDVGAGIQTILGMLSDRCVSTLGDTSVQEVWPDLLSARGPYAALQATLEQWASADSKPVVLFIDEIDSLIGDTLVSVLRQLRAGYAERPARFPQSVILCGVRDVRDYRIHASSEKDPVLGGSAFNVKAKSLRLGDFCEQEVRELLGQHTQETGQPFTEAAMAEVFRLTQGQPWLVNALANEACFEKAGVRDRSNQVALDTVVDARERLILRRDTHLDQLVHKLEEPRVRHVIEPILSGEPQVQPFRTEDLQYVRDLGLVTQTKPVAIANPIYQEVIPRELTYPQQEAMHHETTWYVDDDGALRMDALLEAFQDYFRANAAHWDERFQYKEAGPQLLLQCFLQRVVNGGGRIDREYGIGRGRVDLAVVWPLAKDSEGAEDRAPPSREQRVVIECKLMRDGLAAALRTGLPQTAAYMDEWGAAEGHLVLFDRTAGRPWSEKLFRRTEEHDGVRITVWGM